MQEAPPSDPAAFPGTGARASDCSGDSSRAPARVSGNPDSARILTTPLAARRSANGSFDPLGARPMANISAIVAIRSARPRTWPSTVAGMGSSTEAGNVLGVDGLSHRFAQPLRAGIESPDYALQLGKFLDQLGGEIGLGQAARPVRALSGPARFPGRPTRRPTPLAARRLASVLAK